MKKLALLASSATLAAAVSLPTQAEVSANAGFVSDYYFRGANLGDGGVYGGLDYEQGGFFAGTWWIDDGTEGNDGLETDFYLGYGMEHGDSFAWSVAYNRYEYTYTSDFEHEIVLGLGFGPVSFELVKGVDDDEANTYVTDDAGTVVLDADGMAILVREDQEDYTVFTASFEHGAFGVTVGYYEMDDVDDSEYTWLEGSFGGEIVAGVEGSINLGIKSDEEEGGDEGYMYLDISKSFDL